MSCISVIVTSTFPAPFMLTHHTLHMWTAFVFLYFQLAFRTMADILSQSKLLKLLKMLLHTLASLMSLALAESTKQVVAIETFQMLLFSNFCLPLGKPDTIRQRVPAEFRIYIYLFTKLEVLVFIKHFRIYQCDQIFSCEFLPTLHIHALQFLYIPLHD